MGLFILTGSQQFGLLSGISQSLAGRTGQLLNLSSLAVECGITHNTAKAWISVLEASYIVFLLRPHHANFNKRLVKSPKLYFYDVGLVSWLLGIQTPEQIETHPLRGSIFETCVIAELLKSNLNRGERPNLFSGGTATAMKLTFSSTRG